MGSLLKGVSDDASFAMSRNSFMVKVPFGNGERVLKTLLIDGRFPDIDRVMPKQSYQKISLGREELAVACRRAAILANEKSMGVKFTFKDQVLSIESSNPEQESSHEFVDIKGAPAEELSIGFNVGFIIAVTNTHFSDDVVFSLMTENTSVVITSVDQPELISVVMPMRI